MIRRLVIFLVRRRLGVKKFEKFRFANQKSDYDFYYFKDTVLMKYERGKFREAGVGINWLLSDQCEIRKVL